MLRMILIVCVLKYIFAVTRLLLNTESYFCVFAGLDQISAAFVLGMCEYEGADKTAHSCRVVNVLL